MYSSFNQCDLESRKYKYYYVPFPSVSVPSAVYLRNGALQRGRRTFGDFGQHYQRVRPPSQGGAQSVPVESSPALAQGQKPQRLSPPTRLLRRTIPGKGSQVRYIADIYLS